MPRTVFTFCTFSEVKRLMNLSIFLSIVYSIEVGKQFSMNNVQWVMKRNQDAVADGKKYHFEPSMPR